MEQTIGFTHRHRISEDGLHAAVFDLAIWQEDDVLVALYRMIDAAVADHFIDSFLSYARRLELVKDHTSPVPAFAVLFEHLTETEILELRRTFEDLPPVIHFNERFNGRRTTPLRA